MILEEQLPELAFYRELEKTIPLAERFDYADHVSPNGNVGLPVHRWFRFKESFSAGLLREIVGLKLPSLGKKFRLLDPFCGVGTTLVAAQEMSAAGYDIEATGIESNPFIAFTARTKLMWPEIDAKGLITLAERLLNTSKALSSSIPALSSLTTGRCITRYMSKRILAFRDAINLNGSGPTHDALLLGLASAIEQVSRVRKDGRALRFVERPREQLSKILKEKWNRIATDVTSMRNNLPAPKIPQVILADGRNPLASGIHPGSVDLVITSPPYPNNIDYYEVYKLELWLLGFITEPQVFLDLRRSTFHSHPRCNLQDLPMEFRNELRSGSLKGILEPILKRLQDNPERWRQRLVVGYFANMWVSLYQQYQCLRKHGYAVLVVGNSLHGGSDTPYVIPTDILVARIGERVGFKVEEVTVARPSKRRLSGNHFLRESLIILKKDHD